VRDRQSILHASLVNLLDCNLFNTVLVHVPVLLTAGLRLLHPSSTQSHRLRATLCGRSARAVRCAAVCMSHVTQQSSKCMRRLV